MQLNYRVGQTHQFPQPIHDVLAGYDWVSEHLLPSRAISRAGRPQNVGRVAVCGELLGGGLATMLALTECRIGQPGIVAAAVNNPIVDWIEADGAEDAPQLLISDQHATSITDLSSPLSQLRRQLFSKPEHYFDPFASPILFFRSPGQDIPRAPPAALFDDLEHLAFLEREDFHRHQMALSAFSSRPPIEAEDEMREDAKSKRTVSKRYPTPGLNLKLPPFYISAGSVPSLRHQAAELTQRLRKSFLRQADAAEFGRKVLLPEEIDQLNEEERLERKARDAEAAGKARFAKSEGLGLWDDSREGRRRVEQVAMWLREKLT